MEETGEEQGTEIGHAQLGDRPGFREVTGSNSQCSINTCCMNHWMHERASPLGERVMGRTWGKRTFVVSVYISNPSAHRRAEGYLEDSAGR